MLASFTSISLPLFLGLSSIVSAFPQAGYNTTSSSVPGQTPNAPIAITSATSEDTPSTTLPETSASSVSSSLVPATTTPIVSTTAALSEVTTSASTTAQVAESSTDATPSTASRQSASSPAVASSSETTTSLLAAVTGTSIVSTPLFSYSPATTSTTNVAASSSAIERSSGSVLTASESSATAVIFTYDPTTTSAAQSESNTMTETTGTTLSTTSAIPGDSSTTSALDTNGPAVKTAVSSIAPAEFTYANPTSKQSQGSTISDSSVTSPLFTYVSATASTADNAVITSRLTGTLNPTSEAADLTATVSLAAHSTTTGTSAPEFVDLTASTTENPAAGVGTAVSIGSTVVSVVPVESETTGAAALVIGTQTASVGQTLTVDGVLVKLQTSAGDTELYVATSTYSLAPAAFTVAPPTTTIAGAPTILTIGLATVSKDSAGAYMLGSRTMTRGSSATVLSGTVSAVVALESTGGTKELVYQDASTTVSSTLPLIASAIPTIASSATNSVLVISGHTYTIEPASLNADATATVSSSASGFVTSSASDATASAAATTGPRTHNAASAQSVSCLIIGIVAAVTCVVALL